MLRLVLNHAPRHGFHQNMSVGSMSQSHSPADLRTTSYHVHRWKKTSSHLPLYPFFSFHLDQLFDNRILSGILISRCSHFNRCFMLLRAALSLFFTMRFHVPPAEEQRGQPQIHRTAAAYLHSLSTWRTSEAAM